jgi:hypothetical protein
VDARTPSPVGALPRRGGIGDKADLEATYECLKAWNTDSDGSRSANGSSPKSLFAHEEEVIRDDGEFVEDEVISGVLGRELRDQEIWSLILNKFPVIPNHFLLVTKDWQAQTDILDKADLEGRELRDQEIWRWILEGIGLRCFRDIFLQVGGFLCESIVNAAGISVSDTNTPTTAVLTCKSSTNFATALRYLEQL